MGLIGSLTQAVTSTVGSPTDYNANFEAIRAAFDNTAVLTDTARTIVPQHTFNPASAQAPFILGANAQDQLVTGLNAEKVVGGDAVVIATQIYTHEQELPTSAGQEYALFRMPFDGWLGEPRIRLHTANVGGTGFYRWTIKHGTDFPTATAIMTTGIRVDLGETDSRDATDYPPVFSGTDQADAQRSAGDWLCLDLNVTVSSPTTPAKGMWVEIPVYGYNPYI